MSDRELEAWRRGGWANVPVAARRGRALDWSSAAILVVLIAATSWAVVAHNPWAPAYLAMAPIVAVFATWAYVRRPVEPSLRLLPGKLVYRAPFARDADIAWGEIDRIEVAQPRGATRPAVLLRLHGPAAARIRLLRPRSTRPRLIGGEAVPAPYIVIPDAFAVSPEQLAATLERARQEAVHDWR